MKSSCRRHYYTLAEMIAYMAIVLTISAGFVKLFHSTVIYSRQATRHAESFQQTQLILLEWRDLVNATRVEDWREDNGGFYAGTNAAVKVDKQQLIFTYPDGKVKTMLLPPETVVMFQVDQSASPPVAVLVLSWPSKRVASKKLDQIRLVACVPHKPMPSSD